MSSMADRIFSIMLVFWKAAMTAIKPAIMMTLGSMKPWKLLEMVLAKRMPHALDLRQIQLAWQYIRHFSRMRGRCGGRWGRWGFRAACRYGWPGR